MAKTSLAGVRVTVTKSPEEVWPLLNPSMTLRLAKSFVLILKQRFRHFGVATQKILRE